VRSQSIRGTTIKYVHSPPLLLKLGDKIHQTKTPLGAGFFPLAASFWAALNCALLFGLGAIAGAWRLLGRGLGLAGASDETEGGRIIGGKRIDWTEEGREFSPVLDGL